MRASIPHLLIISFVILCMLSCEDMIWDNPTDPNAEIDPEEWKPSNLQAQVLNDAEIKLTWTQTEKRILGFRIERQEDGGSWTQIAEVGADIVEYTDTNLDNTIWYTYRVAAYTTANHSDYSNSITPYIGQPVIDIDGNIYQAVQIGDQIWMAENLKVTRYRNGDAIPTGHTSTVWSNLSTGAYAAYADNSSNVDTYGLLYNWYAVDDSRNIAPKGWHIPTDDEWKELEMYLGMSQSEADDTGYRGTNEGSKLAGRADLWNDGTLENDSEFGISGFSALPGGYRSNGGNYYNMGNYGYFWSSTGSTSGTAWSRRLRYNYSDVGRSNDGRRYGFSVRCIRD